MPDEQECWDTATLTYNSANAAGMISKGGTEIYRQSGVNKEGNLTYTSGDILQHVKDALAENPHNSIISLRIESADSQRVAFYPGTPKLILKYDDGSVNEQTYVDEKAASFTENEISPSLSQITGDVKLPKSFYGLAVSWQSSDNNVIHAGTGKVVPPLDSDKQVTLTANFTYGAATGNREFPAVVLKYEGETANIPLKDAAAIRSTSTQSYGILGGKSLVVGNAEDYHGSRRMSFLKFDFKGWKSIIDSADALVLNLQIGYENDITDDHDVTLQMLPHDVAAWDSATLDYATAKTNRMENDAYAGEVIFASEKGSIKRRGKVNTYDILPYVRQRLAEHPETTEITFRLFTTQRNAFTIQGLETGEEPYLTARYQTADTQDITLVEGEAISTVVGSANTRNAKLLYAFYSDDVLLDTVLSDVSLTPGKNETAEVAKAAGADRVKVMLLDGWETLQPLCASKDAFLS